MDKDCKGYVITKQKIPDSLKHLNVIDSLKKLPAQGCFFVVIDFSDDSFDTSILHQLRKMPYYQLLPVFYLTSELKHSNEYKELTDGEYNENSSNLAKTIQDRMELIPAFENNKTDDFEALIISYLYVRDNFLLKSKLDYHVASGYQYPLLNLFGFDHTMESFWYLLEGMTARKLLKHHHLSDEIQICTHCKSGLLNFKNCCPNCQSVHIDVQTFVHCFACGNIDPLSEFLRNEEMICNRCHVKLRHVGIDYDKPMEDKMCEDCKHCFFEYSVNAICMVCAKLSPPENLQTKKIYEYSLSERGKSVAKGKDQQLLVDIGQFTKILDLNVFATIVKWQVSLAKRYDQLFFSLVSLIIKNDDELMQKHGLSKTEKNLVEFFNRIRELLRDSDLVSRDDKAIYFYLPMTPAQGCSLIFERLQSFAKAHSDENLTIEIGLGMITSQEILESNINTDFLLTELYNRVLE